MYIKIPRKVQFSCKETKKKKKGKKNNKNHTPFQDNRKFIFINDDKSDKFHSIEIPSWKSKQLLLNVHLNDFRFQYRTKV